MYYGLVEVSEDLATSVLAAGLFVIHDTKGGGEDDETKLTAGQEVGNPLLHIIKLNIETGGDDTTLVKATVELDNNLTGTMIIDDLELANVTVLLHDSQELDDDLGDGTDEDLTLSTLLSIVDALKSIVQHANTDHSKAKNKYPNACWYDSERACLCHTLDQNITIDAIRSSYEF